MLKFLSFLNKKKQPESIPATVDFEARIAELTALSDSAQMTFLYRYVQTLSPNMCTSLGKYAERRRKECKQVKEQAQGCPFDESLPAV